MAVKIKTLTKESKEEALTVLFAAAQSFKGDNAVSEFIEHLLTESEQITIGRRLQIAALLQSGMSQTEIRQRLGVSPSTFSRTRQWLGRELPNYGDAVKASTQAEEKVARKQQVEKERRLPTDPFSFASIKRKYPMESLFFNLADKLRGK